MAPRTTSRRLLLLAAALTGALTATLAPGGPGAAQAVAPVPARARLGAQADGAGVSGPVVYSPPVDAPITDPFRPPPQPWLPGNRGIEYATEPGTPVRSAGRGRVTFAGPVAGALHVTVAHPDGIRTSYSFLASIAVAAGADVVRGQVVGVAGGRLHVGARRGTAYIDPASLWGDVGPPWVRLAPLEGVGARAPPVRRVGGVGSVAT